MITPRYVQMMAAYNRAMNVRVYGVAALLSDEQRKKDMGAAHALLKKKHARV
jgi:uncharacterized damage-inducible protein DinB